MDKERTKDRSRVDPQDEPFGRYSAADKYEIFQCSLCGGRVEGVSCKHGNEMRYVTKDPHFVDEAPAKHVLAGGSTRSEKAPPYHLVPPYGGRRVARRFGLGKENHGEDNWMKSIHESRESALAFCKEAYNHMLEHARRMGSELNPETIEDRREDHLGAIGWAVEALAYTENYYGCRWTELISGENIEKTR